MSNNRQPIKFIIELMQHTAGKNSQDIARELNIKSPTYTQYLNGSFQSLIRFIYIADLCGYKIKLINKDKNMKINLTSFLKRDSNIDSINDNNAAVLFTDSDDND